MHETIYPYDIAVLLPTRGRTDALSRSIFSLMNRSFNSKKIKIMLGFDEDDAVGTKYFLETLKPELDRRKINYEAMVFEPMGYIRLNEYVNHLAKQVTAGWYMFWNDDAMMETTNWDSEILRYNKNFNILAVHTHREHPYSIFPIVPKDWLDIFGYLSPHQMSDAWISQIAYMTDIMRRIDVWVTHDRFDLTGNNLDETFKNRPQLEGNPDNPNDFHSERWHAQRMVDTERVSQHMKSRNMDTSWWENVKLDKQNPWEKLEANDVNKQMTSTRSKFTMNPSDHG